MQRTYLLLEALRVQFKQSTFGHCLFTRSQENEFLVLLICVDDILITRQSEDNISSVKAYLDGLLIIKDLGYVRCFLGLEVAHSEAGLFFNQKKYMLDILQDTRFTRAKMSDVPLPQGLKLENEIGPVK